MNNTLPGLTLFEPGANLPDRLLGVPALDKGFRLAIQLDNLSERDIMLNPKWDIGQLYSVQLTNPPRAGHLPEVPGTLDESQREAFNKLLREYKDVFSKEGDPISSTSMVEHEILHRRTSCKTTFPSTESLSQGTGAKSGEGDAKGWSHPILQ